MSALASSIAVGFAMFFPAMDKPVLRAPWKRNRMLNNHNKPSPRKFESPLRPALRAPKQSGTRLSANRRGNHFLHHVRSRNSKEKPSWIFLCGSHHWTDTVKASFAIWCTLLSVAMWQTHLICDKSNGCFNSWNTYHFKDSVVSAQVDPGYDSRTSNQTATDIRNDIPVQIWQNHHIELLGPWHHLQQENQNKPVILWPMHRHKVNF